MMHFSNTEEAFVLSSLKEFVKVWGSGRQANFNLECRNGLACIKLTFIWDPQPRHTLDINISHPLFNLSLLEDVMELPVSRRILKELKLTTPNLQLLQLALLVKH